MIKLQDAELVSVLPPYIKENVDVRAISYAFKMGMEKFLQYAKTSALYGNVDILPEHMLDLLALELRSQYYDELLALEVKRGIVKNSLAWYFKGGTVAAVEELIQVVFGKGELEEWFQFGGEPGTFRIKLSMGDHDTEIDIRDVMEKIKQYKKLSAHFAAIVIGYYFSVPIHYFNVIHMRIRFYPRFNLPRLHLDGTWKLDGKQQLSGYDGYGAIDLYPVRLRIQSGVRASPKEETQISFQQEAREQIETESCVLFKCQASARPESSECIRIRAEVSHHVAAGEIIIRNESYLDGTWKLDGSRKLNGGVENR